MKTIMAGQSKNFRNKDGVCTVKCFEEEQNCRAFEVSMMSGGGCVFRTPHCVYLSSKAIIMVNQEQP